MEAKNYLPVINEKKSRLESVKETLSVSELRIATDGTGLRIRDQPERDIRKTEKGEKDFGLIATVAMMAKGISKDYSIRTIEKSEAFRFYDLLKKYYSNYTLIEIKTAFELALVGELDEYLPKDRNGLPDHSAYQTFSAEFITKILNAYKKYRGKVWGKVNKESAKLDPPKKDSEIKVYKATFERILKEEFEKFKKGESYEFMFPVVYADYLVELGIIENRELSEKDLKRAYHRIARKQNGNEYEVNSILKTMNKETKHETLIAEANRFKSLDLIRGAFELMKKKKMDF